MRMTLWRTDKRPICRKSSPTNAMTHWHITHRGSRMRGFWRTSLISCGIKQASVLCFACCRRRALRLQKRRSLTVQLICVVVRAVWPAVTPIVAVHPRAVTTHHEHLCEHSNTHTVEKLTFLFECGNHNAGPIWTRQLDFSIQRIR